ncbi:MAG TPA: GNAT family N-acetyltransferase [Acidobacteriaceae bacterium]
MEIRAAVASDLPQITEIYNSIVLTSTAIYNDTPVTVDERTAWWQARIERGFPVLVAADDHDERTILGYGSFGEFRSWPGYRFTVEGTVHIREGFRGRGVGSLLLAELVARARATGKHIMVAGVDSENAASLRFLERHGFVAAGRLPEVGYKFGRFLDLRFLVLRLSESQNRQ